MAIKPTRLSRVSVGWKDSASSLPDYDAADTGAVFSVTGPAVFEDPVTQEGAATLSSTLTVAGQVTASGGVAVGGGTPIVQISTTTHDDDLGTVPVQDSSVITVGHSGATRGDTFILNFDSEWSGADHDLAVRAESGDTTGEVNIIAVNSTLTAVDTTVAVFRLTRINFGTYI